MKSVDVSNWLWQFYSQEDDCIPGDDLATTLSTCGGVVLASVLSGSISPDHLAELTGLPAPLCALVIANLDQSNFWHWESFADVCHAIRDHGDDHNLIKRRLDLYLDDFWNQAKLPYLHEILPVLRGRRLLFGQTQTWVDNDLLNELAGGLEPDSESSRPTKKKKAA